MARQAGKAIAIYVSGKFWVFRCSPQEGTVKKLAITFVFGWQLLHADTPSIRVVNAASFLEDTSLTPGAIISILGPNLANTTALASDLTNVPHTLGGVTVTIGSTTLPLFYVSKTQINARIDPSIPLGAALLTVNSPTG